MSRSSRTRISSRSSQCTRISWITIDLSGKRFDASSSSITCAATGQSRRERVRARRANPKRDLPKRGSSPSRTGRGTAEAPRAASVGIVPSLVMRAPLGHAEGPPEHVATSMVGLSSCRARGEYWGLVFFLHATLPSELSVRRRVKTQRVVLSAWVFLPRIQLSVCWFCA
jgi:hypothetical protein